MESSMLKLVRLKNPDKEYPINMGQIWTLEEETLLLEELRNNMDIELIAQQHGRTIGGITGRCKEIAYKLYTSNNDIHDIIEKTKLTEEQILDTIKRKQEKSNSPTREISELKSEISELKSEISRFNSKFDFCVSVCFSEGELKSEISELKSEIGELKSEIGELKSTILELIGYKNAKISKVTTPTYTIHKPTDKNDKIEVTTPKSTYTRHKSVYKS